MTTLACSLKARGHDPGVIFGLKANLGDICGNWDKKACIAKPGVLLARTPFDLVQPFVMTQRHAGCNDRRSS